MVSARCCAHYRGQESTVNMRLLLRAVPPGTLSSGSSKKQPKFFQFFSSSLILCATSEGTPSRVARRSQMYCHNPHNG